MCAVLPDPDPSSTPPSEIASIAGSGIYQTGAGGGAQVEFSFDDSNLGLPASENAGQEPLYLEETEARPASPGGGTVLPPQVAADPAVPKAGRPAPWNDSPQPAEPFRFPIVSRTTVLVFLALPVVGLLAFGLFHEDLGRRLITRWKSAPAGPAQTNGSERVDPPKPAPAAAQPGQPASRVKAPATPRKPAERRSVAVAAVPTTTPRRAPGGKASAPVAIAPAPDLVDHSADDTEALFMLAEEYTHLGDPDKAEQFYQRLLREKRQPARAALALGESYLARNNVEQAYQMFSLSKKLYLEMAGQPAAPP